MTHLPRLARLGAAAVLAAVTAGCDDRLSDPGAALVDPAAGPALVLNNCTPYSGPRLNDTTVTPNGVDDTCTIQKAIERFHHVHLQGDTFRVNGTIRIPSLTRVWGDGKDVTTIKQLWGGGPRPDTLVDDRANVFLARGTAGAPVLAVTVEGLGFVGSGVRWQYALRVERTNDVVFQNNKATNLGLFDSGHYDHRALPADLSVLNHNLRLSGNVGTGNGSSGTQQAITLGFARDARVERNVVSQYHDGILWWGGDADPNKTGGNYGRWTRNIVIQDNHVRNVDTGIWGSRGDSVRVYSNDVAYCHDLCLDAEGTRDVLFYGNTAAHAGSAVTGVYFYSQDVVFDSNTVTQDGTMGRVLFGTINPGRFPNHPDIPGSDITMRLKNNTFRFTGGSGVGTIEKQSSQSFVMTGNRLYEVVVNLPAAHCKDAACQYQWNGLTDIRNNTIELTRDAGGLPAILTGRNWDNQAVVDSNTISTTVPQSAPAIRVIQDGPPNFAQVYTQITTNRVTGFRRAVEIESAGQIPTRFHVQGNPTTGSFRNRSHPSYYSLFEADNTWSPQVRYAAWVSGAQQGEVADGAQAGTTGQALPMTGFSARIGDGLDGIGVCYRAHVSNVGWMSEVCDGGFVGAPSWAPAGSWIEALEIRLVNPDPGMQLCAQAHVGYIGWMAEQCATGTTTVPVGTTGQNKDMQAIRIRLTH